MCDICEGTGVIKDGGKQTGRDEYEDAPCDKCNQSGRLWECKQRFDFHLPFDMGDHIKILYDIDTDLHSVARLHKKNLQDRIEEIQKTRKK
jgi:hypothetical protein